MSALLSSLHPETGGEEAAWAAWARRAGSCGQWVPGCPRRRGKGVISFYGPWRGTG